MENGRLIMVRFSIPFAVLHLPQQGCCGKRVRTLEQSASAGIGFLDVLLLTFVAFRGQRFYTLDGSRFQALYSLGAKRDIWLDNYKQTTCPQW